MLAHAFYVLRDLSLSLRLAQFDTAHEPGTLHCTNEALPARDRASVGFMASQRGYHG